ncbi:hypothetical protein SAMN05216490_0923 [Mucilaginibacter mallensis]|uniref:Uncharacterized protein n=1 Tax=Mucilaginibacter mallensis TaxID=652787 RepID=A0A1H1R5C5_MUCMA|nr:MULTISPECIES: hypothetical protein [Mucilaginibacter]MBB6140512.1 hypothetical protein [Mucilaginibacter sp. X5P1]SDS30957.1 hypothetical protein SAMN05216490_0923 [Mucilaginibacter mallensis]
MDKRLEAASEPRHYIILVLAIVLGLVGIYLRFADFKHSSEIADVILFIGTIIAIKTVFNIMK